MNVTELMEEIVARWPRFNKRWEPQYREALQNHAGPNLEQAWSATLAGWRKDGAPKPADILANLPHTAKKYDRNHFDRVDEQIAAKAKKLADEAREVLGGSFPDYLGFAHEIDTAVRNRAMEISFALWQKYADVIEWEPRYQPQLVSDAEIQTARKLAEYRRKEKSK